MKPRAIRIEGDIAYVPLTKGYEAIIDAADANLIGQNNWCARIDGLSVYAVRGVKRGGKCSDIRMHRVLSEAGDEQYVDHINCNGLDNRRANLRIATNAQNNRNARLRRDNTTGFKGVTLDRHSSKWRARIKYDGRQLDLGLFDSPEDAHHAYCEAALTFFGDFARAA